MRRAALVVVLLAFVAGCARDGVRGFYVGGAGGVSRLSD